jgi:hypothetical protein
MKKIELRNIEKKENRIAESWKDLAILSMKHVNPQSQLNVEQIGERLKVLKKIQALPHGGMLDLEDAEFKTLNDCAQSVGWQVVDEDLYDFLSAVKKTATE